MQPIATALKYNTYFKSLILQNVSRKDAVSKFAGTIEHSKHISKLVLSGLDADDGFVELGNAIRVRVFSGVY